MPFLIPVFFFCGGILYTNPPLNTLVCIFGLVEFTYSAGREYFFFFFFSYNTINIYHVTPSYRGDDFIRFQNIIMTT